MLKDFREEIVKQSAKVEEKYQNSVNKKLVTAYAREENFGKALSSALTRVFPKKWTRPSYYRGKKGPTKRIHSILLSDTHFQSLLDPQEVPLGYNQITESARLEKVAVTVADYKRPHRKESVLYVHLMGDLIQNQLHDPRDGAPLAEQFAAATHYFVQLILFWCTQYPKVKVFFTPGNHGRNQQRHPERAVHQKWDSIETMLAVAIKTAVMNSGTPNVSFDIGKRPYYTVQFFDKKGFFTHGDTVFKPGYPGRAINVNLLHQQAMKWNTARDVGGPFQGFFCGHVHFGSVSNLPGGVVCITNGCLVPPDPFSLNIGQSDCSCGQYLFESVPGHIVGDQRFIYVDGAEKGKRHGIITPYSGF